jgi:hypothetical protein
VANMQNTLLTLFTEVAIVEHLSRTRFEREFTDGLNAGHFGILNYFIRADRAPDTVAGIAFSFQDSESVVIERVEALQKLGFVSVTGAIKKRDAVVTVTPAGRIARDQQLQRMGPNIREMLTEIPIEDLEITARTLREIRLVMDNLPDR